MNQIPSRKIFIATWGEGYAFNGSRYLIAEDFDITYGWNEQNVFDILTARINQTVNCSDPSGELSVRRVQ